MSDMIYRAEDDEDDQAHIPHTTLWDHRLSVRARGLLAMLLCVRPGAGVSMVTLAREMRAVGGKVAEGRDALRAARRELEQAGYLVSSTDRDDRGQWVTRTRVYRRARNAQPTSITKPQVSPGTENPAPGDPAPVNPARDAKPQVSPGTENPAPGDPAPVNPALSSSTSTRREEDDEEDARARANSDPLEGRPALRGLAAALIEEGIRASWPSSPSKLAEIESLMMRHEVDTLVIAAVQQDTNARTTPGRTTAEYVSAFLPRWRRLSAATPSRTSATRSADAKPQQCPRPEHYKREYIGGVCPLCRSEAIEAGAA